MSEPVNARQAAAITEECLGHLEDAKLVLDQLKDADGLPGEVQAKFSPELRNFIRRLDSAYHDIEKEADAEESGPEEKPYTAGDFLGEAR